MSAPWSSPWPLLEPGWHWGNIGFRAGHGPQHGIAMIEWLMHRHGHPVMQAVDIRKAFTSIPKERLIHAVRKSLPPGTPGELLKLLEQIIRRPLPSGEGVREGRGIPQGSPLSPLLLNVYLNRILDMKWDHQRWPLIRYADDMLLLARSQAEAATAVAELRNLLTPNGLNLRDQTPDPAHLAQGDTAEWLGYRLEMAGGRIRVSVTADAWTRLASNLRDALYQGGPWREAALQVLRGWLEHAAPAFRPGKAHADYRRDFVAGIHSALNESGVDTGHWPKRVIHHMWSTAHSRWDRRRRSIHGRLSSSYGVRQGSAWALSKTAAVLDEDGGSASGASTHSDAWRSAEPSSIPVDASTTPPTIPAVTTAPVVASPLPTPTPAAA